MAHSQGYVYNEHDENQVKKILKNKKKKKFKRKIKAFIIMMILVLIASYFVSDYSRIQSIEVSGNHRVSTSLILDNISINKKNIYLFIDKKKVANEVKELGLIKKANVSCDFFGHLSIEIEEADPVAYCVIDKKTYVIDELGKVSETNDKKMIADLQSTPQLKQFPDLKFLELFAKEYVQVSGIIKTQTSDITYAPQKHDETRVEFLMDDGKKIYVKVEDMVSKLETFDYEAYTKVHKDKCVFSFEGKLLYLEPCK